MPNPSDNHHRTPEPDLVDPENIHEAGPSGTYRNQAQAENDRRLRHKNDGLLGQAINYVRYKADSDPPKVYQENLEAIEGSLLEELAAKCEPFSHKLYNILRDMVSFAQIPKSKVFKYGGPKNSEEVWHGGPSSQLPFAETFQLKSWESLKIQAAAWNAMMNSDKGKFLIDSSEVPFDHPKLTEYKKLAPYDSGSHFKLPDTDKDLDAWIEELGSDSKVKAALRRFNWGDPEREEKKDYAPRIFLDKFAYSKPATPSAIRRSLNTTPIRRGHQVVISSAQTIIIDDDDVPTSEEAQNAVPAARQTSSSPMQPTATSRISSPVARRISLYRAEAVRNFPIPASPTGKGKENETPAKAPQQRVSKQSGNLKKAKPTPQPRPVPAAVVQRNTRQPDSPILIDSRDGTPTPQPGPAAVLVVPNVTITEPPAPRAVTPPPRQPGNFKKTKLTLKPQPTPAAAPVTPRVTLRRPTRKPTAPRVVTPRPTSTATPRADPRSTPAPEAAEVLAGPSKPSTKALGKRKRTSSISEKAYTPKGQGPDESEHGSDEEEEEEIAEPPAKRVTRNMSKAVEKEVENKAAEKKAAAAEEKKKQKGKAKAKGTGKGRK